MALRMDAGLSALLRCREMVREPTGSPVSMYSRTMEVRISICRVLIAAPLGMMFRTEYSLALHSNRLKGKGQCRVRGRDGREWQESSPRAHRFGGFAPLGGLRRTRFPVGRNPLKLAANDT